MYQNFGPIEEESRPEANLTQSRWGNVGNEGHGVVPIKGHADPLGVGILGIPPDRAPNSFVVAARTCQKITGVALRGPLPL